MNNITPPVISPETLEQMKEFFMRTSIPRILKELETQQKEVQNENQSSRMECHVG